uniref:U4/U6 small nuclear ribonucleoprotein Prp31 n=1 Tax=Panagrolaimus sp. PS1159 TaxID=55785 RepID=A0AC35FMW8_9BILA
MSLAEDLLADVEEDGDEDMEDLMPKEEEDDDEIDEITEAQPIAAYNRVTDVAKLMESDKYKRLINELQTQLALTEIPKLRTPLEMDPQYILVVSLSELAAEIDQEVQVIHKFIRDKYEKRFPELESLVMMPFDYIRTVKILGNDIQSRSQNKELLGEVLAPATVMVVSVTASTSQGKPLEPEELEIVMEACDMAEALQEERVRMHQYVEQRMALIAPNLCAIVGAGTAAITASILPHAGFIYFHPIVQTLPPDYRQKATKIIAAKCTLAARVDSLHESPDGGIGRDLSAQIQQKIDKMLEPPPVKNNKALPKPLDKASKKRGGRRVRKTKEMMGMTELRRKTNRMNFGELQEDVSQEHIGFTLGQAASTSLAGGGRIRGAVVDNKTRVKMSQKMQRQLERQRQQLGGATSIRSKLSGTQSSISFTPVQGLEIVNQNRDQQPASSGTSSTYFSATSNFIKVQTPLNRLGANSKLE